MKYLLSIAAVALFALPLEAATHQELDSTAKIIGAWKMSFTTPDDVKRNPIIIIGRQQQQLVAWYVEKDKPEAFKEVRLKDDALLLTIRPKERPDVTVTLDAKLKKDGVCYGTGTFVTDSGETESCEFQGKRVAMSEFDDVMTWNLSFVTPDEQQRKAVVTVLSKKEKLYGWYSSKEYELPATELSKNGDKVVMSITAKTHDGENVDVTFRGTVAGDQITGDAKYELDGDTGSFPFRGERKSLSF